MTKHTVTIRGSKLGSIGTKYCEVRQYVIDVGDQDDIHILAIQRAYQDGLEHILVTAVDGKPTFGGL